MHRFRFGVLGPLEAVAPDGTPIPLGGPKARELLAAFLVHRHLTLSADRLVDMLWGEGATSGAATTLRTHVAQVRRVLAAVDAPDALVTRSGGYALVLDDLDLDAGQFEHLAMQGQEALGLGRPEEASTALAEALRLWRGDVLSDLGAPTFAAAATSRLDELRLGCLEASMSAELELGRHQDVVGPLQELVATHPFRERFCALLMLALYRSGRQVDALSAYAATKERLADELGLDPTPELQDLHLSMLRHDPLLLQGFASTSRPAAGRPRSPQPPDAVLTALRRTPMVGRDDELRVLERCWEEVVAEGRALVLVQGEAGAGKSRLVADLAHRAAQDGAQVLVGRCEQATRPYHPIVSAIENSAVASEILRDAPDQMRSRLGPLLAADTDSEGADPPGRPAFFRAVTWLVSMLSAEAPVLFLVEGAEQIDAASSVLLRNLAGHLPPGVMVVICFRDPPGGRHPPLLELLGDPATRELAEHVRVGPLQEAELEALVAAVTGEEPDPGLMRDLWIRTHGNPFFATELVRDIDRAGFRAGDGLARHVPEGVRDVLRHRFRNLPTATRDAISAAAVLGQEVELVLLGRLLDQPEERVVEAVEEGLSSGFLVESGQSWSGGYAFPHELLREAVYLDITPGRRERLHHAAATVLLETRDPSDDDVVAAALHLRRAGSVADPNHAADIALRASAVAQRGYAWIEAVDHAEAALPFLARAGDERRLADVQVAVAMVRLKSGIDYRRALDLLTSALATYLALGDTAAAGTVHSRLGGALCLHHSVRDIPRSLEHFAAAERLLPEPAGVFHLHRGLAQAAMHGLRSDLLAAAAHRAEAVANAAGRRDLLVFARWAQAWDALNHGRLTAAFEVAEDAWRAVTDVGDSYLGWGPANAAAMFATEYLLDPVTGRAWSRRAIGQPRFESFGYPHGAVVDQLALAQAVMGDLEVARRTVEGLPEDAVARRVLHLLDGDWERAARDWGEARSRDEAAGDLHDAVVSSRWLATALDTLGQTDRAVEVLQEVLTILRDGPQVPTELLARAHLVRLQAAAEPDAAAEHLRRCEEIVGAGEDWRGLRGEVVLGRSVLESRSDRASAQAGFEEAVEIFARYRLPWRQAEALQWWADALSGSADAATRAAQARALYTDLGAAERWHQRRLNRTSTTSRHR